MCCDNLAQNVTETVCSSYRFSPYKNVHNFLWTFISGTWPRLMRSITGLLESVTFYLRFRIYATFSATSIEQCGYFSNLGWRSVSITTMLKNADLPDKIYVAAHDSHLYCAVPLTASDNHHQHEVTISQRITHAGPMLC